MDSLASTTSYIAQFPTELFFIAALWLVASAFAYKSGVSRISAITLALVTTGLLFPILSVTWPFPNMGTDSAAGWASSIITFALLAGALIFIMRRIGVDSGMDGGRAGASVISAIAFTIAALALWAYVPAIYSFYPFPALLAPYFAIQYFFWWIMGALATLAVISQNRIW